MVGAVVSFRYTQEQPKLESSGRYWVSEKQTWVLRLCPQYTHLRHRARRTLKERCVCRMLHVVMFWLEALSQAMWGWQKDDDITVWEHWCSIIVAALKAQLPVSIFTGSRWAETITQAPSSPVPSCLGMDPWKRWCPQPQRIPITA